MRPSIESLTNEIRLNTSKDQDNNLVNPQEQDNTASAAQNSMHKEQHHSHADSLEVDTMRKNLHDMEDRTDHSKAYQPAPQVQYQESNTVLNYVLLIIGCAAFMHLPIVAIPILASSVAVSCGITDRKKDIENYLKTVHQNPNIRNDEIKKLKSDIKQSKSKATHSL